MHHTYPDIIDLADAAGRKPLWWDENGVPRFCAHHPAHSPDVYAREVALLEVACQGCGRRFLVQMAWSMSSAILSSLSTAYAARGKLSSQVLDRVIHYGDPPNVGCCAAGPTMNCEDLRVVEFWRQTDRCDWERVPDLEVELP